METELSHPRAKLNILQKNVGMSRVQIWALRPAILTEGFRGFPESLQANAGRVS
jgi:hypothetical protein